MSDHDRIVEIHRIVAELAPLTEHMPRLMALLDPFARARRKRGRDAFPFSPSAPLHVGPASADRRTVDTQVWE